MTSKFRFESLWSTVVTFYHRFYILLLIIIISLILLYLKENEKFLFNHFYFECFFTYFRFKFSTVTTGDFRDFFMSHFASVLIPAASEPPTPTSTTATATGTGKKNNKKKNKGKGIFSISRFINVLYYFMIT